MRIVLLDGGSLGPGIEITRPAFDHTWESHPNTPAAQVIERLSDADIAITNKVPIGADVLAKAPKLKMISVSATGYDMIDAEACRAQGVTVSNVQGYAAETVPEHTFALMLALWRSVPGYREDVLNGEWERADQFCLFTQPVRDLHGSTLGIIGSGVIGQAVGRLGSAFGMKVLFATRRDTAAPAPSPSSDQTPPIEKAPFDAVLETADVLTLHLPLTPETRDLIAMREFQKMKRRPLIINTARGGLVNEADAVAALDQGLISGIGVDVLTTEPPDAENPLLKARARPEILITPHVAWASDTARQRLWDQAIRNIENYQRGNPSNVVA